MGLFEDCIAIDAYALPPGGTYDRRPLRRAAKDGSSQSDLARLAEERMLTEWAFDKRQREEMHAAWALSGLSGMLMNAADEGPAPARMLARWSQITQVLDVNQDCIRKCIAPPDFVRAAREGVIGIGMSCNGVPLEQSWATVGDELRFISAFFRLGCRMMHLTYNRANMLGSGCGETSDRGVTDFGRSAILEMNRVGVIVDVAHCGQQTSLEAARESRKPVLASHTSCGAVHAHCRGKSNKVVKAIVNGGGAIGICCIPAFLGGNGDIGAMLAHLVYARKKFGDNAVCIGTDRAYRANSVPFKGPALPRGKAVPSFRFHWPAGSNPYRPEWKKLIQWDSMAMTNWPLFSVGMVQRRIPDRSVRKILGGNLLRIMQDALPSDMKKAYEVQ